MPKVFITNESKEISHFTDFIRGELKRQGKTHSDLAAELGISRVNLTNKINGRTAWSLTEIVTTLHFLNVSFTFGRTA